MRTRLEPFSPDRFVDDPAAFVLDDHADGGRTGQGEGHRDPALPRRCFFSQGLWHRARVALIRAGDAPFAGIQLHLGDQVHRRQRSAALAVPPGGAFVGEPRLVGKDDLHVEGEDGAGGGGGLRPAEHLPRDRNLADVAIIRLGEGRLGVAQLADVVHRERTDRLIGVGPRFLLVPARPHDHHDVAALDPGGDDTLMPVGLLAVQKTEADRVAPLDDLLQNLGVVQQRTGVAHVRAGVERRLVGGELELRDGLPPLEDRLLRLHASPFLIVAVHRDRCVHGNDDSRPVHAGKGSAGRCSAGQEHGHRQEDGSTPAELPAWQVPGAVHISHHRGAPVFFAFIPAARAAVAARSP